MADLGEEELRRAVRDAPTDGASFAALGAVLEQKGEVNDAALAYSVAGTLMEDNGLAAEQYRRALSLDPVDAFSLHALATILAAEGDVRGSESLYRRVLLNGPSDYTYASCIALGHSIESRGKLHAAARVYNQALDAASPKQRPDTLVLMGHVEEELGQHREALRLYRAAGPRCFLAQEGIARVQCRAGDLVGAEATLRALFAANPSSGSAASALAAVLEQKDERHAALTFRQKAAELEPLDVYVCFQVGYAHEAVGDTAAAVRQYEAIAAKFSYDPEATANAMVTVGFLLEDGGIEDNARMAELQYRKALAVAPSHPWALYSLSCCLFYTGRLAEAEPVLRALLAVRESHAQALAMLGRVVLEAGDHVEAAMLLEQVAGSSDVPSDAAEAFAESVAAIQRSPLRIRSFRWRSPWLKATIRVMAAVAVRLDVVPAEVWFLIFTWL